MSIEGVTHLPILDCRMHLFDTIKKKKEDKTPTKTFLKQICPKKTMCYHQPTKEIVAWRVQDLICLKVCLNSNRMVNHCKVT